MSQAFNKIKIENKKKTAISEDIKSDILRLVEKFPVVSFDIFDTVLFRRVTHPTAVFDLLEKTYKIENFKNRRIKMEKEARSINFDINKTYEINIHQIYSMEKTLLYLKKDELNAENIILTANIFLKEVIDECMTLGKKVVLVSDTYFDKKFIVKILKKNRINYDNLFVSSELNKSKAEGSLFPYVLQTLNVSPKNVLHIGDNYRSDILLPKSIGIETFHLRNIHESAKSEANEDFLDQASVSTKMISGMRNVKKVNGHSSYWNEFGYSKIGPIVVGWCNWIKNQIQENQTATVFFLSRDGFIPYMYFKQYPIARVNSQYLQVSRVLLLKMTYLVDKSRFFQELSRFNSLKVWELLETYGLEEFLKPEDHFTAEELTSRCSNSVLLRIKNLYLLNDRKISNKYKSETRVYEEYLKKSLKQPGAKFIVDIGWKGTNQELIQIVLKTQFQGLYLGLWNNADLRDKKSWAFNKENNVSLSQIVLNGIEILETGISSKQGHLLSITKEHNLSQSYKFNFEVPEESRIFQQQEIFRGAESFWKELKSLRFTDSNFADPNICFAQVSAVILNPSLEDLENLGQVKHKVLSGSAQEETSLISPVFTQRSHWLQGELRLVARFGKLWFKFLYIPKMLSLYGPRKTISLAVRFIYVKLYRSCSLFLTSSMLQNREIFSSQSLKRMGRFYVKYKAARRSCSILISNFKRCANKR